MSYSFILCDVFTDTRFGGNPLAVLPQADGLSDEQMQQIAREFNFSESTFVLPSTTGCTRRVRIFTPLAEMPFAGHPNIGTAFALASTGELDAVETETTVTFEEKAGTVPIRIRPAEGGSLYCELEAPQPLALDGEFSVEEIAAALTLSPADIVADTHPPREAGVGAKFVLVQLRDRSALERAQPDVSVMRALRERGATPHMHLYVAGVEIRARMFAPLDGVPEDPATGSANCALAGLLAHSADAENGSFAWTVRQGVEMGRPSLLKIYAEKQDGTVTSTRVGGNSVMVGRGEIEAGS